MTLRFFLSVLMFGICGLTHVLGFPLEDDDDIRSARESGTTQEKRLWRNWDDESSAEREWLRENVANSLYKRLWRFSGGDMQAGGSKQKIKRLWRSQENTDGDSLCVTCAESRCKRATDKMNPNGGKTLPCCNC